MTKINNNQSADSPNLPPVPDYTALICSDSEYAMKSVMGIYNGQKNKVLIGRIRSQFDSLQKLISEKASPFALPPSAKEKETGKIVRITAVKFQHVKGHSGHRWNDRADFLAGLGAHKTPLR